MVERRLWLGEVALIRFEVDLEELSLKKLAQQQCIQSVILGSTN